MPLVGYALDLPGKHEARIQAVSGIPDHQVRLGVYLEAARSPDAKVRELATFLLSYYPESTQYLPEALNDSSKRVVKSAREGLNRFSEGNIEIEGSGTAYSAPVSFLPANLLLPGGASYLPVSELQRPRFPSSLAH